MKNIELPLLTPSILRTAKLSHEGHQPVPPATDDGFVAKVKSQTPPSSPGQPWQLQLDVGGRSLTVTSERSLPPGSSLVLTLSKDEPPALQVQAIQLPATATAKVATGSTQNTLESQLMAAALQLRQSPALPSAVRELLAARLPFYAQAGNGIPASVNAASGQSASTASSTMTLAALSALQSGALSASKPTAPSAGPSATATQTSGQTGQNAPASMLSLLTQHSRDRRVNAYNEMAAYRAPPKGSPSGSSAQHSSLPTPAAGTATAQLLNLLNKELMSGSALSAANSSTSSGLTQQATEARQTVQSFIRDLPSQQQLSQPETLKRVISNNPLNFEKLALNHVLQSLTPSSQATTAGAATQRQPTTSTESLTSVMRHLWNNGPGATATRPTTTESLQSLIQQLTSAAQSKTAITDVQGLPGSLPAHAQLPAELSTNLKGLLLLISRQILQAGNAAASAQPNTPLAGDLAPGLQAETFRLLQAVLARTEQDQVRLIQQQDPYPASIPLLYSDGQQARQITMDIHRDETGSEDNSPMKKRRWHITLHFDLDQLGPLDVELELQSAAVSARFWSEQTHTLAQLNAHLQPLRQQLATLGAEVGELEVRHGRKLPDDQQLTIKHSLVDVRT